MWVLCSVFFKVGDMLLMDWQVPKASSNKNSDRQGDYYIESNFYWNTNWNANERKFMIPFQKHPKSNAQEEINRVHKLLEDTVGTIKFIERTSETAFIRYRGSANPGICRSGVGRFDGITYTTIGTDCFTGPGKVHKGIAWMVLHEIMHALGFYHEHQRPDRDIFVNVDQTKMTSNCFNAFKLIQMNSNKRKSDEYDHKSIMHYGGSMKDCIKDRINNTPYMTLKSGQEIPENKELSAFDIQTLKEFYAPPIGNMVVLILAEGLTFEKKAMTVGFDGKLEKEVNFSFGDGTDLIGSCGVTFKNEHYMFGGDLFGKDEGYTRQVLKVIGCKLKNIMDLEFDFYMGACGSYNIQNEEKAMLCFGSNRFQKRCFEDSHSKRCYNKYCYWFDGNNFDRAADSSYDHSRTSLASYQGRPFVTGGFLNSDGKTEIFSTNSFKWESGTDYPFTLSFHPFEGIYSYATTSTEDAVFIIGGINNENRVAEYKNGKWTNVGDMEIMRIRTRSITFGGQTMIISSEFLFPTVEIWDLEQRNRINTFKGFSMHDFGVFLIQKDFCN